MGGISSDDYGMVDIDASPGLEDVDRVSESEEISCPECEVMVDLDDGYCPWCGTYLFGQGET